MSLDRRLFLAALGGAALVRPSSLQAANATSGAAGRWPTVQKRIDGFVAARQFAGLVLALSRDGGPVDYPAAGTLALDSVVPVDENSIYRIYSMTKQVTRFATLLLVEDGKLSLDQPVADVLPEFRSLQVAVDIEKGLDARPATKTMTMRHLITHTSGLANWTPGSGGGVLHRLYREHGITPANLRGGLRGLEYGPQAKNLTDMVERVARLPLAYEPGTTIHYSIGFDVMGLVIERVSGMTLGSFLQKRFFIPLDMPSSGFQVAAQDVARLTTNYDATPDGLKVTDPGPGSVFLQPQSLPAGGGGLVSTARDFARFATMVVGEGALGDGRVMKVETMRLALSNLTPPGAADPSGAVGAGSKEMNLGSGARPLGPAGSFGGAGAAGTFWWADPARRSIAVFLSQAMGFKGGPANHPAFKVIPDDIAADLGVSTKGRHSPS